MDVDSDGARTAPTIDPSACVAHTAVIAGDVTVGAGSVISYGAVLVADGGAISIGRNCVVMENAVIRSSAFHDCRIGDNVMVGPHCHLSGCDIGDEVFVATGVSVFNGARVGRLSELRINAVVHVGTRLQPETTVPIGWIAVGDPAVLHPPERHEEIWRVQKEMDFPWNVFGVRRAAPSSDSMTKQMTDKYSRFLIRHRTRR